MSKKDFHYSISPAGVVREYRHFDTRLRPPVEMLGLSFPAPFYDLFCDCETDKDLKRGTVTLSKGRITIEYSNHETGGTVKIEGVAV